MTNTKCTKIYSIDDVKVFLAHPEEMKGVEPYEAEPSAGVNAYSIEDWDKFIELNGEDAEPCRTYYEDYSGDYSEEGDEIICRQVMNVENHQATIYAWVLVNDEEDADCDLIENGLWCSDIKNEYPLYRIAEREGYDLVETTEGSNGYPRNLGEAVVGFDSYEDAEEVAEKYGKHVVLLHQREGWNLWEVKGTLDEAHEADPDDFDKETGYRDEDEVVESLKDQIDGLDDLDAISELVENAKNVVELINDADDDEVVFCDYDFSRADTFRKYPTEWSNDSHRYCIAVC